MNSKAIPFVKEYNKAVSDGVSVKFMNAKAMAGYYLVNYNNAMSAIDNDTRALRVPFTVARTSKVYISVVQKEKNNE